MDKSADLDDNNSYLV